MPDFFRDMARTLDLGNTFTNYNYSRDEDAADTQSLLSDWRQVGKDLNAAMEQMGDG